MYAAAVPKTNKQTNQQQNIDIANRNPKSPSTTQGNKAQGRTGLQTKRKETREQQTFIREIDKDLPFSATSETSKSMDKSFPADKNSSYSVSNNDASTLTAPSAAAKAVKGQGHENGEVVAINGKAATTVAAIEESTAGRGKKSSSSTTSPSPPSPSSPSPSSSFVEDSDNDNDNESDIKNKSGSDSDDDVEDAMMSSSDDESEPGDDDGGDEKKSVGRGTSKNYDTEKDMQSSKSNVELSSTAVAAPPPEANMDRAVADGTIYTDKDVLSGRGGATNLHAGNKYYRELILSYRRMYDAASKSRKPEVARIIVEKIRARGGRFLRRGSDDVYHEIDDTAARAKTRQALRHRMFEYRNMKEGPDREKSHGKSKVAKKGKGGTSTSKSARGRSTRAVKKASKASLETTKPKSKMAPTPLPPVDYEKLSQLCAGGDNPLAVGNPALHQMAARRQLQQQIQLRQDDSFLQQAIVKQRELDALEVGLRTTPLGASNPSVQLASLQHQHHQAVINLEKAIKDVRDVEQQRRMAVTATLHQVAPGLTNPIPTSASQHPLHPPSTALARNATGLTVPLLGPPGGGLPNSSIMGRTGNGIALTSMPNFPLALSSLAAGTAPRASAPTTTTPLSLEKIRENIHKREQERYILDLQHIQRQQQQS